MFCQTKLLLVILLLAFTTNRYVEGATTPAVSWYYRGSSASNGTTLSVNSGSALVLGCTATTTNNNAGGVAFVVSKGSVLSTFTLTNAASGVGAALTVSGGTIIWDSINGHRNGYDYFIISAHYAHLGGTATPVNAFLQLYVPSLSTSDAGTYYCSYIDGSATSQGTATSFANSGSFVLTITTKSGSASSSISRNRNLEYSLLLIGATKFFL